MTKSSAEVEREVEASRGSLDRTVEALKGKMSPGQLFDEFGGAFGESGSQILSKLLDQAKENPMPLAVMGIGLAWLMSGSDKKASSSDRGYGSPTETGTLSGSGSRGGTAAPSGSGSQSMAGAISGKAHDAVGKITGAAAAVGDGLSNAASSTRDGLAHAASDAGERMSSIAGGVGDQAAGYGKKVLQTFMQTLESEPLIIGAVGIAVGMALGAAFPSTAAEDRLVGPFRDRIVDKGVSVVHEQVETVKGAATDAFTRVKDEISHQGGPDGATSVADKVAAVAKAGVEAVQDRVEPKSA